jgi:3-oxoacyl-ACP reductase-like protein
MPYGMKNETPKQTAWLEKCVGSIGGTNKRTGKPYKKGEKIAICKSQLKKQGGKAEFDGDMSIYELEEALRIELNKDFEEDIKPVAYVGLRDVYDDYVICAKQDTLFKLPYTISDDGDVSFNWEAAQEVVRKVIYEVVAGKVKKSKRITQGYRTV